MTEPHDAPDAAELLEAVRGWIEHEVAPAVEGRLRFHARVAVNALAIVERELELGPELQARHAERLARLGFADDAALAAAIAAGDLDARWEEIAEAIEEMVRDKLLVADPGYLER